LEQAAAALVLKNKTEAGVLQDQIVQLLTLWRSAAVAVLDITEVLILTGPPVATAVVVVPATASVVVALAVRDIMAEVETQLAGMATVGIVPAVAAEPVDLE
jgi:hypothetical protein